MPGRTAGRKGYTWRKTRQAVFATKGDLCCWCGHPDANAVNHDDGRANSHPSTWNDPRRCSPIHGHPGCPWCPKVWSRRASGLVAPNCNSILGGRPLAVALAQRAARVRDW